MNISLGSINQLLCFRFQSSNAPQLLFSKKLFVFIFWDEFKKRVWSGGEADRAMKILNGWNKKSTETKISHLKRFKEKESIDLTLKIQREMKI